jgi:hypothetical protein
MRKGVLFLSVVEPTGATSEQPRVTETAPSSREDRDPRATGPNYTT